VEREERGRGSGKTTEKDSNYNFPSNSIFR
jgi:hypothetical protein